MELRHLRAFVAIADTGHYGRAAASLKLTQPAITQRIQVLERELGVQLFTRNAREVHLTLAGDTLIEHARSLVLIEDRALAALRDHQAGIAGRLRISYQTLWDIGFPADLIAEYRRRYPAIMLEMTTGYTQSNIDRLVSGEIDFAFIGPAVAPRNGLVLRPVDRQEIVVVIPATHRFAQLERVPIESLRGEPIVGTIPGINPKLNAASLDWLTKYIGEPPNIIREEPPDQIAGALGQSGNAISFMSIHRAVIARAEGLDYRRLKPSLFVEFGVAYARDNPSPPLANLLTVVDDIAPAVFPDLPNDSELLGGKPVRSRA